MLNELQKQYCAYIYQAIKKRESLIRSPEKITKDEFLDCIKEVRYKYPELFYIDFDMISYLEYDNYFEYKPTYLYDENEISKKKNEIDAVVGNIISKTGASKINSVYKKCGLIHNYLVSMCTYNHDALNNHDDTPEAWTIEGVFLKKTAVCLGISLAFKFLCDRLNVETIVARGFSLEPGCTTYERHAWNIVCSGECAAHIDVTWDMCLSKGQSVIRYDYFFLPDLEAMRDHQYVGYPICRQLKSTYFEKTGTQFDSIDKLGAYVKRGIEQAKNDMFTKDIHFQFKMINRKETKNEIYDYIKGVINGSLNRSYTRIAEINDTQSVFLYSICFG